MRNLKLKYLLSLFLTVFLIAGCNLSDTDKYLISSNENVLKIGATENDEENSDIKTSNDDLTAGENQISNISTTENKKIEYGKIYTSKDEVALYIHTYNELPINFITKTDAKKLGWDAKAGNLRKIKKNASIGGDRLLDIKRFQYKYMAGFRAVTQFFDGLMYFTVILFASKFMLSGKITPADMVAYTLYVSTLLMSIRHIVEFAEQFERGMTGIERFSEVMETPVEIKDSIDAVDIDNPEGDIKFDNVSFKYSSGDGMVISNLDLHIKKGQKIVLVGPSGSGKTTLCNLIPRFYDVSSGKILLDNIDITKIKLHSLRDHIGMVQQDVYIFSGTVFQNIEYGKPGASHDEVIEAAKLAGADEFISKLDKGYDTYVGERGVRLSGGQKQRISIARVFLKNPPILILDEATSSLDNESERLIQNSLEKLEKGRTVFTIAHRLTTVKNADRILVMTDGGIVESGTHKDLMALQGEYYNLYKLTEENLD